jgi:RNA polymerase sigma factor (sigma-70 family)
LSINALHAKAGTGDKVAEEKLFQALSVRFYRFACQRVWDEEDAREVVQDTLMKIAKVYRDREFTTSFSAWAYKVLKNQMIDHLGKRQRMDTVQQRSEGDDFISTPAPDPVLELKLLDCLKKIGRQNIKFARTLNLKYQGYSVEDICTRLEISRENLYTILSRARSALELCLEKGGID